MKRFSIVFALTVALCALGCTGPGDDAQAGFRVGVSSAAVNPPVGTYLAGYDQDRRSTGIHDDLCAKAIVFADGTTSVALVVIDAISIQYPTTQQIRERASAKVKNLDLPPEHIITQATHTHCAPDTIGIYGPDQMHTGLSKDYMDRLVETAADVVARAAASLQPATLYHAKTECVGWAVNDSEPEILDNSVTILECKDAQGKTMATLTNFACHPTVLDGDTTEVSADWVGTFYKRMAEGRSGVHFFLQGSVGCWIQPKTPERTFALAARYGADLAEETLAALTNTTPLAGTAVRVATKQVQIPQRNPLFTLMSTAKLVERSFVGDTVETEVAWFAVGPAQFATHPAETAPEFTFQTRELMNTGPKFVLGLGLDHLGYFCPPRYFDDPESIPHAPYLTQMSPGKNAGPVMMAALREIIP